MYNKLFTKILDSSIWLEPTSTRIVWITLIAAMDEDGYAHFSAIENLAARARVTTEEAAAAIECFLAPDPNSANPANDGRRVERVPGGFVVLNAQVHRATINRVIQREQTKERVQRFRERLHFIKAQNKLCACCSQPFEEPHHKYVVLDHDHNTGEPRALLCQSCNKVVGQIENRKTCLSPKKDLAIAYLVRYGVTDTLQNDTSVCESASAHASDCKEGDARGSIPPELDTEQFRSTLAEFEAMRKEIKKPVKPTGRSGLIRKLAKFGHDKAIIALENSIAGQWQGVFEPQGSRDGKHKQAGAGQVFDGPSGRGTEIGKL